MSKERNMKNEQLKNKLKELINQFNKANNSYSDRIVSQIEGKKIHKELLKLKPCFLENLETEEQSLDIILENIYDKDDNGYKMSEIEIIAANYIVFIYHVEKIFFQHTGVEINEKSEEEQELEELDIYL